jgi:hypothetical protein
MAQMIPGPHSLTSGPEAESCRPGLGPEAPGSESACGRIVRRSGGRVPRGLFLLAAALLQLSAIGCAPRPAARLVVVGLDGATWDLLEPWIQAGDLPNLKAFRDGAAWGTMTSVVPYLSPSAWTSAVTGVNPGRHGIFDFQRRLPGQRRVAARRRSGTCSRAPGRRWPSSMFL